MDNDIEDKRPDTDDDERDGGWRWSVEIHARATGGIEIIVAKVDEETLAPFEVWSLPVHPGVAPTDYAALVAFVRERGVYMGDFAGGAMREKAKEWRGAYEENLLRKGDQVPCECCGAATGGETPFVQKEHMARIVEELQKPDPAGRVWWSDDLERVAVCEAIECRKVYQEHLVSIHQELGLVPLLDLLTR